MGEAMIWKAHNSRTNYRHTIKRIKKEEKQYTCLGSIEDLWALLEEEEEELLLLLFLNRDEPGIGPLIGKYLFFSAS